VENFVFQGIVAAPFLPMNEDESIDWKSLQSYYRWLAAQRPTAIAINMDASEGSSLTREEQLDVLRATLEAVDGACPVLSGVMASFTADAVRWGNELKRAGAQGLVVFPPLPVFLGNPLPSEMVVRYHAAIGGIGLPFVAFQLPKGEGPDLSADVMRELVKFSNFIGVKEASCDAVRTIESVDTAARLPRKLGILTGSDQFILEAMLMGCDGALIGFAGTATEELIRMHAAVRSRDTATAYRIWDRLGPLARYCWRLPERDYRPRMKEVLVMQGLIRSAAVRAPQMGIGEAERAELRRLARHAGLIAGA
jgi:4-hydroxy-tetrahydrodipicolinate synthase